jgi:hypothetical protein
VPEPVTLEPGFIGRRAAVQGAAAQPHEVAAVIRRALLARCGARPASGEVDAETVRQVIAGGSDATEDGGL